MIPLVKGRKEYQCKSCNRNIVAGEYGLDLGSKYNGGSKGRCCLNCIVETADKIKQEVFN